MAKFTNCLQIVNAMPEQDQDALLARLDELQARGMSPKEAQLQAAIDVLAQVEREGGIRKSPERDANFKRWSGGAPVIELGDDHEFRSGQPVVVEALHGTTNADLTEFKRSRANPESDMGAGFYASNTPEDVAANYANVDGPDLTQRVEMLAERLAQNDEFEDDMDAAREEARKRLSEGAPNTMKLFMRFKNPAVLGGRGETFLDYNEAYDEETDEYGEPEGKLLDFVEELRITAPVFDVSDRQIETAIGRIFEEAEGEGVKASVLHNIIKDEFLDAADENGNSASSEVFRQVLSEIGFDGVIDTTVYDKFGPRVVRNGQTYDRSGGMSGMTPDTVHFIAFEPEQIKSATGNSGEFGENRSILKSVDRPQFYSQLQRAIEGVPDRLSNMGALGWKQWIDSNGPKLGVKKDEIEWSGIKDYLDLQGKKKLSKDDLSAYLDDSGVKISEVMLRDDGLTRAERNERDDLTRRYAASEREEPGANFDAGDFDRLQELEQNGVSEGLTKYGKYQLPGGENYRELLITLPLVYQKYEPYFLTTENGGAMRSGGSWTVINAGKPDGSRIGRYATREEAETAAERQTRMAADPDQQILDRNSPIYNSTHWEQPNVLAHIRVNDRTDADGKRVLFVEEVQSDWGQQGRENGFGKVTRFEYEAVQDNGQLVRSFREKDEAEAFAKQRGLQLKEIPFTVDTGIPVAPFVTKTEGWLNLALKRVAMMAVEGGYDKVAFVSGEQSADRYDLSKQIQSIAYSPEEKLLDAWDSNRRKVMRREITDESQLEDYVGKEVARRLLATKPVMGKHLLDGEDIKVGGEGMKTFYDKIVPQALNKLLPKLGGEKLGKVGIDVGLNSSMSYEIKEKDDGRFALRARADANSLWAPYGTYDTRVLAEQRMSELKAESEAGEQPGFDVTDKMRETVGAGLPLFSRDRQAPNTPEFKKWFGDSKVIDENGEPLMVYTGTSKDVDFKAFKIPKNGAWFTDDPSTASAYALENDSMDIKTEDYRTFTKVNTASRVMPVYLRIEKMYTPTYDEMTALIRASNYKREQGNLFDRVRREGFDGVDMGNGVYVVIGDATQIKSAIGNDGSFDATNPDIRKSADRPWFEDLSKLKVSTNYQLGDLLKSSKKLSWWDRTVGTQYNLATKQPEFKRVFDAVQSFINDVSAYATRAADMAPTILPKLESFKDIVKQPMTPEDVAALRDPVFGGTLKYARDENGELIETDDVQKAGVVFTDEELKTNFKLTDDQVGLYRQFRKSVDQSVTDLALSDMVRYLGEDGRDIAETVMASGNVDVAVGIIESHLGDLTSAKPQRAETLNSTIEAIQQKGEQANRLMDRGYAPLSRFGQFTTYVVSKDGEQLYFGMFENERDAQKMAREMREQYPDATVSTSTMSQESYKLFSGVTPETLALFGDSLGLEESGIDTKSEVFQQYLKVAKTNRSAMKRLIERKGIDGFSEDAGRVLAGFVYSNARQISTNLHAGEIGKAAADVKDGDVKDAAIRLMEYIQNPQEEAQAIRGLLFTQFIGGSIASALVNMTQPFTMTAPYLAQFDGVTGATRRMGEAMKLVTKGVRNDADLQDALKRAEDEGIVSPQEVHQLMAQARGKGSLITGDGTKMGDAAAKANNFTAKLGLAWGKAFSAAEQFNRRITFIAAYKLARDKGMENPFAFAEQTIAETQGIYNKGNKPAWARGAIGGTLFTFKQYSISYVEFLRRMWGNGPEGKKAVGLALGVLFMSAGLGGMPGADDLDDVIDGFAQRVLGKSFDSKQAKKEFFASILGQAGAEFVMTGLTGLPGAPIDLSGRLGLGNLIPGTGIFTKKSEYGRDVAEIFGPAGSLFKQVATGAGKLAQGDVAGAAKEVAPVAAQNVIKSVDMAVMGMYRDTKGRKVIDTDMWEAVAKGVGFQPASVKRVQDATGTQQNLIGQNKLRETEIADKWAAGRIERNPGKVEEAKAELAEWNRKNPQSPIRIDNSQINRRVQQAMMEKAKRLEKTAPKEIRDSVRRELERASN